ncbi:glycosyltransferase [Mucilaginibacter mali]|uniref:Glycosyltransferase n=1 Tax=Mucilaginibacter mali TaxID=2740462 RepID=A0A7D4Q6P4_9SPHI|nr:glycosyltransferase family 2 protein [Mucilaginibacter mali]QKJ29411.1 glycosyltransferase [Mucilaginibacter mali]
MTISIITVVYNNNETILDAIQSVLSQKNVEIEYIVIDGGSTDGTVELIKKNSDQISVFISEPDLGIYDAMNKGIGLAKGDVIGILNSDDVYANSNVLNDVCLSFRNYPETEILYGDLIYVKKDDINKKVRSWKSMPYYKNFFEKGNVPPHPTLFVRSHIYQQAGVFDIKYKLAADYEFMLRIFKKYDFKAKYVDQLMVKMRLGGATNKSISNILNGNKEIVAAWKKNGLKPPLFLMPLRFFKRLAQFF